MVVATIERSRPRMVRTVPSVDAAAGKDRFNMFMRMPAHAYHHVGQMIYLCRELSKTGSPEALIGRTGSLRFEAIQRSRDGGFGPCMLE